MKWTGRALPLAVALALTVAMTGAGSPPATAQTAAAADFNSTIQFSFQLNDLVTNQQFPGQTNSFDVTYEYVGILKGAAPGVVHSVGTDTFPYFETIRNDMKDYILGYGNKAEFYELLGNDIGRYLLGRYPQLRWIEITIHVPAFATVEIPRSAKVRVTRGG